ncbi:peptide chain release factor N(5)-glutamine methyltransferase [Chakrabartyella piscis]|uniref:peptide chain release factor N(5)-glutamine methyltransferase n=1 Tax=Chakrabartyella piscis TaxID=2918914 RepID=UPI0029584852|nr:peptide chain release factor N(5)-glutamine methyltransferase [Chakrabartyella piscis]
MKPNQKNKTIATLLQEGKDALRVAKKENAVFEAEWLLMEATGLSRVSLLIDGDQEATEDWVAIYETWIGERLQNRPLQYIIGHCGFMGLPFSVGEGVLIPRADTEILVERVLAVAKVEDLRTVVDFGTGSGCIPISLAYYGNMQAIGVDISPKALAYARKNGTDNNVDVTWLESDLFTNLPNQTFDCIVSNPPYIQAKVVEELMPEVKDFEPRNALDGGVDGLIFYRQITEQAPNYLKDGGWLFFEIGYDQGSDVQELMETRGFVHCIVEQDLAGLDRVVYGKWQIKR